MGLLDDAIREHLELKRRRGADSNEISRQEHEAFGPARRGDIEHAAVAVEEHPDVEPALDHPAEFAAEEAPTTLHAVDPEPVEHVHVHDEELSDEPRPHGDPADHLPHVEPPAPAAPPPASVGQPTREFDPDEVRAATGEEPAVEGDEEEGDVLEETPEFLQETPEHDRLWFEQRPPRDFDF